MLLLVLLLLLLVVLTNATPRKGRDGRVELCEGRGGLAARRRPPPDQGRGHINVFGRGALLFDLFLFLFFIFLQEHPRLPLLHRRRLFVAVGEARVVEPPRTHRRNLRRGRGAGGEEEEEEKEEEESKIPAGTIGECLGQGPRRAPSGMPVSGEAVRSSRIRIWPGIQALRL